MKNTEFLSRKWIAISCNDIRFCYQLIDAEKGLLDTFVRIYKSTPQRVARIVFASDILTYYKSN